MGTRVLAMMMMVTQAMTRGGTCCSRGQRFFALPMSRRHQGNPGHHCLLVVVG
jgi:hypothetical protein